MIDQSDSFVIGSNYRASTSEDEVATNLEVTALALAVGLYLLAALVIL